MHKMLTAKQPERKEQKRPAQLGRHLEEARRKYYRQQGRTYGYYPGSADPE